MKPSLIFIGSTHFFIDDFQKQKEIIEEVNPEFVLSEDLENIELSSKKQFLEILDKKYISEMTSFEEVERLIKLCLDKNIKLVGIDLPNFGFNKILQSKIRKGDKLTEEEEGILDKIIKKREKRHLKKILQYKKKTKRPLVIILGSWHLRKDSPIRKNLKGYKIIAPMNEDGEVLFKPPSKKTNKGIKYGEIIEK